MSGHVANEDLDSSNTVYVIPIEAKKKICSKDMSQLAQYMTTMANGPYISLNTSVGMLVDESAVAFAFSCLCSTENIPLPVVFLSPAVKWRSGPVLVRGVCVAMCLLHNLRLKRLQAGEQWEKCLGSTTWKVVHSIAREVKDQKMTLPGVMHVPPDFLQVFQTMQAKVETLKKDV